MYVVAYSADKRKDLIRDFVKKYLQAAEEAMTRLGNAPRAQPTKLHYKPGEAPKPKKFQSNSTNAFVKEIE